MGTTSPELSSGEEEVPEWGLEVELFELTNPLPLLPVCGSLSMDKDMKSVLNTPVGRPRVPPNLYINPMDQEMILQ